MSRYFISGLFFITILFSDEIQYIKQQNILYVKNLIKKEENIVEEFENYLLKEFRIPTLKDLQNDNYLGQRFSLQNKWGEELSYLRVDDLKLKYAITEGNPSYIEKLYRRNIYRNRTSVYFTNNDNKYVLMKLKKEEAKTIFNLLKNKKSISKKCNDKLKNTYCSKNINTLRWYDNESRWIEYSKKKFENSNITISNKELISNDLLKNLKVGVFIYVKNQSKYIKLINNQIKKVE